MDYMFIIRGGIMEVQEFLDKMNSGETVKAN